jgi:hypothetical protein
MTSDPDRPGTDQATDDRTPRRVSVPEAALLLGISEDAVRSRLRRRTLRKEKTSDGTVYVILDGTAPTDRPTTDADQPTTDAATDQRELVEALRDELAYLRQQLDAEREAGRRKDHLLAAALERIPAIEPAEDSPAEPAPDAQEGPQTASKEATGGEVPPEDSPATEGHAEPRSWWRRIFGG